MRVSIPSRFNPEKTYLNAEISVKNGSGIAVSGVSSPLTGVNDYYNKNINNHFDFSFLDDKGFHSITGSDDNPIRNLLVLLAYEQTLYDREVHFQFSNELLNEFTKNSGFNEQILSDTQQTLERLELLMPQNGHFWAELGIWVYFKFQKVLLVNEDNNELIGGIFNHLSNSSFLTIVKNIYRIDPSFLNRQPSNWTYQQLRGLLTSDKIENREDAFLLGAFSPKNGGATTSSLQDIARKVISGQNSPLPEQVKLNIARIVNEEVADIPEPRYLPITIGRTPENVAQQILKHYNFSLPSWDEVLNDLGTVLIRHNLGNDFLGLFVSNPDLHQSAIIINNALRSSGSHNFTIAHELGHYLLHNAASFLCKDQEVYFPKDSQIIEQQANAFSVELLMPRQSVSPYFKRGFSIENVQNIANECHVSMEAAARRWIQLAKKRQLAFISIVNNEIVSIAATQIKDNGMRWIGKASIGSDVVPKNKAVSLYKNKEVKLSRYLPSADRDCLQDLEIHVYPFVNLDGYYLFIEKP